MNETDERIDSDDMGAVGAEWVIGTVVILITVTSCVLALVVGIHLTYYFTRPSQKPVRLAPAGTCGKQGIDSVNSYDGTAPTTIVCRDGGVLTVQSR